MTKAIRNLLVVGGAGERPTKSSLTSPVCTLPECSPGLNHGVGHLAPITTENMSDSTPVGVTDKELPRHPAPCISTMARVLVGGS